ncbi:uncharacterized protein [Temnothorax longispinosus]|uniref:uncharacterized protein n=1 Tax=Temnothorax longispinosus TaxID=300112 RepID=UPI003A98E9C9
MTDCKPVKTPLDASVKLHDAVENTDIDESKLPYRELLGSLMYLAQGTRPDIAHARVLRYLKGTIIHGLYYTKRGKALIGYTDADWGNCGLDRRSYTGSVFLLANAAISWESRKQRTVTLSSTKAEYTALMQGKPFIYLNFFQKLAYHHSGR